MLTKQTTSFLDDLRANKRVDTIESVNIPRLGIVDIHITVFKFGNGWKAVFGSCHGSGPTAMAAYRQAYNKYTTQGG
jgi:hypothetical protein